MTHSTQKHTDNSNVSASAESTETTHPDDQQISDIERKIDQRLQSELAVSPIANNAVIIQCFSKQFWHDADLVEITDLLNKQCQQVAMNDDMNPAVEMLAAQAVTLDTLFTVLVSRAGANLGKCMDVAELYMKLGLKAQSQSRCTLETISRIKNPPNATFVKQANIAHGHQQVNNGPCPTANNHASREEKKQKKPNELLEEQHHGERLDIGTQTTASGTDQNMETMATVNRATD